jgi:hypothetical protein
MKKRFLLEIYDTLTLFFGIKLLAKKVSKFFSMLN